MLAIEEIAVSLNYWPLKACKSPLSLSYKVNVVVFVELLVFS